MTREEAAEHNPEMLFCDGLDDALMGVMLRFGQEPVALYDYDRVIAILQEHSTYEEAVEHFEFNVIGAWVGEHTPAFARLSG